MKILVNINKTTILRIFLRLTMRYILTFKDILKLYQLGFWSRFSLTKRSPAGTGHR